MKILGLKEGHDGAFALIEDGKLSFCLEAEKDSYPRSTHTNAALAHRAFMRAGHFPDVIATGGWTKGIFSSEPASFAGYFGSGEDGIVLDSAEIFGRKTTLFSSSHERSHIWCAYGLSPFPQGTPCYVLVWEGNIGNFYYVDERLTVRDLGCVLTDPGNRYTFLFSLVDRNSPDQVGFYDISHPGKMMALAAFGSRAPLSPDEQALTAAILTAPQFDLMTKLSKKDFEWSPFYSLGVETQAFKDLARKLTDRLVELFLDFARRTLEPGLPLAIAGGCGLNCEWNSVWRSCGLFSDVFVPPCANDSGSAIGTGIDAMRQLTGVAKLEWTVYAGEEFAWDTKDVGAAYEPVKLDYQWIAQQIAAGAVIAWVEGRYEIGPRALGHRSLLAEPLRASTRDRLNSIKQRESYRPIAPICLESDFSRHFSPDHPSPHMLYFFDVIDPQLEAVTHVDGSARAQSLSPTDAPLLATLLERVKETTGRAILCNTSLNFKGRGFINRMSDLVKYSAATGIDGFVVDGNAFWSTSDKKERPCNS